MINADGQLPVLIASDDASVRERVAAALRAQELPVQTVSPDRAMAAIAELTPRLLVLDLSTTPPAERFRVLDEVRSETSTRDLPILTLLATATRDVAGTALARGADDFLVKPLDLDELTTRIAALSERSGRNRPAPATARLTINLFDPLRVQLGDRPPIDERFPRRKAKALFVYLYLNRGRQLSKYEVLDGLWPDSEHADPGRVKHTVQVLRAALEGPRPAGDWQVIQERGGFYSFNAAAERYSDLEDFDEQVLRARRAREAGDTRLALRQYRRAIELHRGEFLAEFRYDDWAAAEIARVQELHLFNLEDAARLEAAEGHFEEAIELLRSAILQDPLHESSYVELMRCLWLAGRRTEALRVYQQLREILAKRLEVEPQAQSTGLYEAIRHDQAIAV